MISRANILKKIDFTDQSVYPEFYLSTAHLKVDLTKKSYLAIPLGM